jgi:nucleoside-diphosphate-sugar epimerase
VNRRRKRALLLAGNGFIGSRTSIRLADDGGDVIVHHTGGRPAPSAARLTEIVSPRTHPPIVEFPQETRACAPHAVIHFLCMGAEDASAFVAAFDGVANRLVLISSCDVYRAYGRFIGLEPGPPDPTPLSETAPVRNRLHPYRSSAAGEKDLRYWYEKLEAERIVAGARLSEFVILRLPKVYGAGGNQRLDTVYGFRRRPEWRWTHGHVDNVAAAISTAAFHPRAAGETFNVGELETPTIGERLARLPQAPPIDLVNDSYDFEQQLHFQTTKIRSTLGYRDVVDEGEAMASIAVTAFRAP